MKVAFPPVPSAPFFPPVLVSRLRGPLRKGREEEKGGIPERGEGGLTFNTLFCSCVPPPSLALLAVRRIGRKKGGGGGGRLPQNPPFRSLGLLKSVQYRLRERKMRGTWGKHNKFQFPLLPSRFSSRTPECTRRCAIYSDTQNHLVSSHFGRGVGDTHSSVSSYGGSYLENPVTLPLRRPRP